MPQKPKHLGPLPAAVRRRRLIRLLLVVGGVALLVGLVLWPFWRLSGQFDDLTVLQPSRLYATPVRVYEGRALSRDRLIRELEADGYRKDETDAPLPASAYRRVRNGVAVHLRSFTTPEGEPGSGLLEITFQGRRVAKVVRDGEPIETAWLEPALLASYYGPDLRERRPVTLDEAAEDLVAGRARRRGRRLLRPPRRLAAPASPRAAWVNLRGGEVRQGGSTLTQQLVKNLYLTHERTLARKAQEAVLAVLVEVRYSKRADPRGLPQRDLPGRQRRRQPDRHGRRLARLLRQGPAASSTSPRRRRWPA